MEKNVIRSEYQHGLVFDMIEIFFDKELCEEVLLNESLNLKERKTLFCAIFINEFQKLFQLNFKTNYGNTNISFDNSINLIDSYSLQIYNKLKNQLSIEQFNEWIVDMESLLQLNNEEAKGVEIYIVEEVKKNLFFVE